MNFLYRFFLKLLSLCGDTPAKLALSIYGLQNSSVCIYGAGEIGVSLVKHLNQLGIDNRISGIVDRKAEFNEFELDKFFVVAPDELPNMKFDVVVIASDRFVKDMLTTLNQYVQLDNKLLIKV